MDYLVIVVIAVFAVVLLIVIFSSLAKKKNLNRHDASGTNELEQEVNDRSNSNLDNRQRRNLSNQRKSSGDSNNNGNNVYSSLLYYVNMDNSTFGPFSLEQLKTYPLLEDTLITTNTLNGTWYEAKYFECLDDLFRPNLPFRIDADGTIIRD